MVGKNDIVKIILPSTYQSEGVNVYLIKGDKLTLVDTGGNMEGSWNLFKKQLNIHGYRVNDIKQIILTHHHVDHIGHILYFDHDVTLMGHSDCDRWLKPTSTFLEKHDVFFNKLFNQLGVPDYLTKPYLSVKHKQIILNAQRRLDHYLEEGAEIPGLSEWRVYETFGHSQGHISLYRPQDGILIGGDILISNISSTPIIEPPHLGEKEHPKPQLQFNEALRKLLNLPIQKVLSGHGEEILKPKELIITRLNKQHERAMQVKDWLVKESMTTFDVCRKLFPNSYESKIGPAIFETLGHIEYLTLLNLITEEQIKYEIKPFVNT